MRLSTSTLAATAGALFAVTAAIDIPHDQSEHFSGVLDYLLEVVFSLSMAASAAAAWSLLRSVRGRLGRSAWTAVGLGYALLTVVTAATAASGRDVLGPLFALSLLAIGLGSLALSGADLTGRLTPRGTGLVMLVGMVAMVALGEGYGVLAWATAWFAVAALARPAVVDHSPESTPIPA